MRLMTNKTTICYILLWLTLFCKPIIAASTVHHELQVSLDPNSQQLQVTDRISLASPQDGGAKQPTLAHQGRLQFLLHRGLSPRSMTAGVALKEIGPISDSAPLIAYQLSMPEDQRHFTLKYGGKIAHRLTTQRESPGRASERLRGTISEQGVYLDAATGWYPYFADTLHTFELQVELPSSWLAVSQGKGPEIGGEGQRRLIRWHENSPQDDIYLVAAPYRLYRKTTEGIEAQVFLRQPDTEIAERYIEATADYLRLYQSLIGPYPYAKFALVENFWESGYGMPSFTLLGPRVLRLPFILHTSYPHEILHNWWGNSVYIDYQSGNWAEGLTSYLADHLLAEQRGRGANHRRTALKRYGDFVRNENDFPLTAFRARHTTASQAVGYDKSLMFFHMLRRRLGDHNFIKGLQIFFRDNRFKTAGYADLKLAFEKAAGVSIDTFFQHWTERNGAPRLAVSNLTVKQLGDGFQISGTLQQSQSSAPFPLKIPMLTRMKDGSVSQTTLSSQARETPFTIKVEQEPQQLQIDPWFDLFRQLDPAETPATLSRLFGSERILIVLPSNANKRMLQAYRGLAQQWSDGYDEADIRLDSELNSLPQDRPIWLLGRENLFHHEFVKQLSGLPFSLGHEYIKLTDTDYPTGEHSFVLSERNLNNGQTLAWVAGNSDAAITRLTRKLPHYGKYSYLVFKGDQAQIAFKGEWPITQSPLHFNFAEDGRVVEMDEPGPLISMPE
ncbi:MAG: M1 family peptidase [Candidatus Thiodiazotropha sp. (ex Lucina pensylvanica)]|nr:M1 family peptidase [Candidatus Thiodiazotropha sp. (ex Lucina pensylvanica)]MBT3050641.1 M1 family peptidase [Candidatus Thiodiazotropha sp. (ex Codakia orbicularis)]